jgi:dephospho-CoA kinase
VAVPPRGADRRHRVGKVRGEPKARRARLPARRRRRAGARSRRAGRTCLARHRRGVAEFGPDVARPDRQLDRKRLGALVFADPARRKVLEGITHPAIAARRQAILAAWADEGFDGLVVLDIPLLFEVGASADVDRVVLVYAEPAVQLARLVGRDGFDRDEAARRVASQMPLGEKVRQAHFVIDNSGTPEETTAQVRAVHAALLAEHRARRASGDSPA